MNPVSQFDIHPDAEALNGFMEQALPSAERAEVLAHLATCSRCRQIVALAQDAAPVLPASTPAAIPREPARQPSWFRWLQFAGAAAAACALIAVGLTVLRHHELAQPTQIAKASQEHMPLPMSASPAPPAALASPALKLSPKATSSNAMKSVILPGAPAHRAASAPLGSISGFAGGFAPREPLPNKPALPQLAPPAQSIPAPTAEAKSAGTLSQSFTSRARQAQAQRPSLATHEAHFQSQAAQPALQSQLGKADANGSQAPQQVTAANQTIEVNASPAIETEHASSAQLETISPIASAHGAQVAKVARLKLPSGLPSISTAVARQTVLAIDAAGSLFLRAGSDKNWKPVPQQWTGHAMRVRIAAAADALQSETSAANPVASAGDTQLAPLFELINDSNVVWTSADGLTWVAK
jgi:hypothetical protein